MTTIFEKFYLSFRSFLWRLSKPKLMIARAQIQMPDKPSDSEPAIVITIGRAGIDVYFAKRLFDE